MATSRSQSDAVRKQAEPVRAACPTAPGEGEREPVWAPVERADRAAAFRVACRLFRGFDLLPDAVVETIHGFPFFFVARRGALTLREREIIARAITGEPPGSFGADPSAVADEARRGSRSLEAVPELSGREQELAHFTWKVTQRWASIAIDDVERLLAAGYGAGAVREAADVALAFRVIHRLTLAVAAHLPVVPATSRHAAAHVGDRAPRPHAPEADDDEEAFVILRAAPAIRDGVTCKGSRAALDFRRSR